MPLARPLLLAAALLSGLPAGAAAQAAQEAPPGEVERDFHPHGGLIVTGGTFWVLAYVEDIIAATALWASSSADPTNLYRDLFGASLVPLAGPFIQIGLDHLELRRIAWGLLGAIQVVGLVLVGLGHAVEGSPEEGAGPGVAVGPSSLRARF